jgi:large subunit ribosomal protein L22
MAHFPCRVSRLISSARQVVMSSHTSSAIASSRTASISSPILSPSLGHMHKLAIPSIFSKHGVRSLSTVIMPVHKIEGSGADFGATSSLLPIPPQADAENFAAYAHANRHQKVKPFIIKRRIKQLRTYIGDEKNIRHSPWRMNLVCQFAAGLTVPEALKQLMFCQKRMAPLVAKVIRDTANTADRQDGLQPSQLEVAECFSTHGTHLKRLKIMGRGR